MFKIQGKILCKNMKITSFIFIALLSFSANADFPEDWPNDPGWAPSEIYGPPKYYIDDTWWLFGFEPRSTPDAGVSGISADLAWKITIGNKNILIAVLDSGLDWDNRDYVNQCFINKNELPEPRRGDGSWTPGVYDLDNNGYLNIKDYLQDPRVNDSNGNGIIDPGDLILIFSDGIDNDNNGFVDDISGWDFYENDNYPEDNTHYNGYSHGNLEIRESVAEGNNGLAGIGSNPNGMFVMIRIWDAFVVDLNYYAQGIIYAADMGANVALLGFASFNNPHFAREATAYAHKKGVLLVAPTGDELSFHHNYPSHYANVLAISTLVCNFFGIPYVKVTDFLRHSNFTNHGAHLHLSFPSASTSISTAAAAGVAGLVFSRGWEIGFNDTNMPILTPDEVKQTMCLTAEDVNFPPDPDRWPSKPGWDQYFGYGRCNARHAVERVAAGKIPPEVYLTAPEWFLMFDPTVTQNVPIYGKIAANRAESFDYSVAYAVGVEPDEDDFINIFSSTGNVSPVDGFITDWDITQVPINFRKQVENPDDFTVTIRVRAFDNYGNMGEDRRVIFLHHDEDLKPGFPLLLGSSGESPPKLYDLDGDGDLEIIFGLSDGYVYVMNGDGSNLAGWPKATEQAFYVSPYSDYAISGGAVSREGIMASVAVGDIDNDRSPEIVAGTMAGKLYVWDWQGNLKTGFPVELNPEFSDPANRNHNNYCQKAIFASPVLADINSDGYLDIVVAGGDQHIYVWNYRGELLPGFPVLARDMTEEKPQGRRIVSSPAVGDIDGDGKLEIVVGTNEGYETRGKVYAFKNNGTLMKGWPVNSTTLFPELLPVIGTGTPQSPILVDVDRSGKLKIIIGSMLDNPTIYNHDGTVFQRVASSIFGEHSNSNDAPCIAALGNYSAGDIDGDGDFELITGSLGLRYGIAMGLQGNRVQYDHLISVWDINSGRFLPCFPRKHEDLFAFTSCPIADLDNDGKVEFVFSSGGYIIHAMNHLGKEPSRWPKFHGNWIAASPAIGDVDGDGLLEVVGISREGFLFIWDTPGLAYKNGESTVKWQSFHNDSYNTGVLYLPTYTPTPTPTLTPTITNTPTPTNTPYPPQHIYLAGYMNTTLNSNQGGSLELLAITYQDLDSIEITFEGVGTGIFLSEINPYIWRFNAVIPPGVPVGSYLFGLIGMKNNIKTYPWPHLLVLE